MLPITLVALSFLNAEMDVVFANPDGFDLKMDIYKPAEVKPNTPAVVVLHGGAWVMGKRQDMALMARTLADEGYIAATVSYRLAPIFKWPSMIDDAQCAVRYLRANSKRLDIDPNRIGAVGASAGAHLALLLGTRDTRDTKTTSYPAYSSRVKAVVNLFGPTDVTVDFSKQFDAMAPMLFGKERAKLNGELVDFSPINHLSSDDAPIFIFHGKADTLVPVKQSERLEARCKELGIPVEAVYLDGVGHEVPTGNPDVQDALRRGLAFLKRHL